jgi:hypothetical protein
VAATVTMPRARQARTVAKRVMTEDVRNLDTALERPDFEQLCSPRRGRARGARE